MTWNLWGKVLNHGSVLAWILGIVIHGIEAGLRFSPHTRKAQAQRGWKGLVTAEGGTGHCSYMQKDLVTCGRCPMGHVAALCSVIVP